MQKRGGGRFGKYGDLKRKEKIRQTRLLKRDADAKLSSQWSVISDRKKGRLPKSNVDAGLMVRGRPKESSKPKTEDVKR
jgi:hypothetical protein